MKALTALFTQHFGFSPDRVTPLGGAGSNRRYYRLTSAHEEATSVIGVVGEQVKENHAFLALARTMRQKGLHVPEVIAVTSDEMRYLQEDLGHEALYDRLRSVDRTLPWPTMEQTPEGQWLQHMMRDLPHLQYDTPKGFDFASDCSREPQFSSTSIHWDLNYCKYCFLKPSGYTLDELLLENDFKNLENNLLWHVDNDLPWGFLYRDFQARNVMLRPSAEEYTPYYIDFQGGYQGPPFYDVASFLWQTRAAYPATWREALLHTYLQTLQQDFFPALHADDFRTRLNVFVVFRLLQTLGTYGFRGLFEHKAMFITPIGDTLRALRDVLTGNDPVFASTPRLSLPYLTRVISDLAENPRFAPQPPTSTLTVRITSFSFKKGIPDDPTPNGGGFVFDCRAPLNPGRYTYYKTLTGRDAAVIDFLEGRRDTEGRLLDNPPAQPTDMQQFVAHALALVSPAVHTYLQRGFTHLMISCGCTGGQHRSVYTAEHLAHSLHLSYPAAHILLTHRELQQTQTFHTTFSHA